MKRIKIQRIRWLGHVTRMDSSNPVRKVFESEPGSGSRRKGRPRQHWAKQVNENVTTLGIRNWRQPFLTDGHNSILLLESVYRDNK